MNVYFRTWGVYLDLMEGICILWPCVELSLSYLCTFCAKGPIQRPHIQRGDVGLV